MHFRRTAPLLAVLVALLAADSPAQKKKKPGSDDEGYIPLVVPEVNPEQIHKHVGIIANPNCSTIIMNVPVWPLHKVNRVKRIIVSTYQAVSGAGAWEWVMSSSQEGTVIRGAGATQRSVRNAARISEAKTSGCSHAAK